jgi:hypothetical protein
VLATSSLRHSRIHTRAPRRVVHVSARRICLKRRVPIGSRASGFAQQPSIARHRVAPLPWLRLPKPCHRIRHWSRPFLFHTVAPNQTLPLLLTHEFGCRHAEAALRCATVSLPRAPSRFAAQVFLQSAMPNYSWCGRAGSGVPFLGTAAARRTTTR